MRIKKISLLCSMIACCCVQNVWAANNVSTSAVADGNQITGMVNVSLTLNPGCTIQAEDGASNPLSNGSTWFSLTFGSQTVGASNLDAHASADIECTKDATPQITIAADKDASGGQSWAMKNAKGDNIPYQFYYLDSSKQPQNIAAGTPITIQNGKFELHAKTNVPSTSLSSGAYSDQVTATLSW